MQGIFNAETGERFLWVIVNSLSWWGPKTMTLLLMAWIDFVQEVHSSTSSDTAVRALWHFQKWYIFWNTFKAQYLSVT